MNKRIRNKIAKQEAVVAQEVHNAAPIAQRMSDDIAHSVADMKQYLSKAASSVVAEVKAELKTRAPDIEKVSQDLQDLAKKIPLVGDAASEKIGELGKKVQDQIAAQ